MILKMKRCPPGNRINFHNEAKNFVVTRDELPEDTIWLRNQDHVYVLVQFEPASQNGFLIMEYVYGETF